MSISMPETETVKAERSVPEPDPVRQQPENRDAATEEKAQPVTERQETGTHEPEQAPTVQLTLFDLWEYTEEERNQALSGKKKKSAAKSKDRHRLRRRLRINRRLHLPFPRKRRLKTKRRKM